MLDTCNHLICGIIHPKTSQLEITPTCPQHVSFGGCIIQDFISWISSNILLALSSSLSIAVKIKKSGNYQPTLDNYPSIRRFVYTNLVHHLIKSHTSFYALIFFFKVDVFINGKYLVRFRYAQFKHATTPIMLGIHNWNVKFIFPLVWHDS